MKQALAWIGSHVAAIAVGLVLTLVFGGELRAWLGLRELERRPYVAEATKRFQAAPELRIPAELAVADLPPATRRRMAAEYGLPDLETPAPAGVAGGVAHDRTSARGVGAAGGEIGPQNAKSSLEGWDPLEPLEPIAGGWAREVVGEWELGRLPYGGTALGTVAGGRVELSIRPNARPFLEWLHRIRFEVGVGLDQGQELAGLVAADWRIARTGRLDHGARFVGIHTGKGTAAAAFYVAGFEPAR